MHKVLNGHRCRGQGRLLLVSRPPFKEKGEREKEKGKSIVKLTILFILHFKIMRELNYWLRIISGIEPNEKHEEKIDGLIKESSELKNVLDVICSKVSKNQPSS